MSSTNLVLLVVAVATAAVMLSPPLLRSRDWRATVTPLASIIGSGFLVAGPILGHVAGHYAVAAMAALCAISYLFGLAVRDNISRLEPMLAAESPPPVLLWLDRAADLALILAYFVSVAYYLDLLADFALKAFGVVDPMVAHGMTTAILALLGTLGYFGGLRWLEHVELGSVGLKLAMIAALIAALAWALGSEVAAGTVAVRPLADQAEGFDAVRILLGLIILVQGFETSRYLGDSYDRATRVRTMRHAQWIAFVVYMLFIGLLTPWLDGRLPPEGGDTHVIELLRPVGTLVAPAIIVAALLSQLSAAVADLNGASGLVAGASRQRIPVAIGYVIAASASIAVVWAGDIFTVIAWASKAFVLYYGIQSATALVVEWVDPAPTRWGRIVLHGSAIAIALAVLTLGRAAAG
jgi:hypothetical protein